MDNLNNENPFEGMEGMEEVRSMMSNLLDNIACQTTGEQLKKLGSAVMEQAVSMNLTSAMRLGGIISTLSIIALNPEDIERFSKIFLDFAADKLRETLSRGDKESDNLLDVMSQSEGKGTEEAIRFLDSNLSLEEYLKEKEKGEADNNK